MPSYDENDVKTIIQLNNIVHERIKNVEDRKAELKEAKDEYDSAVTQLSDAIGKLKQLKLNFKNN